MLFKMYKEKVSLLNQVFLRNWLRITSLNSLPESGIDSGAQDRVTIEFWLSLTALPLNSLYLVSYRPEY